MSLHKLVGESLQQLLSIRSAKSLAVTSALPQLRVGYLLHKVHSTGKTLIKLVFTCKKYDGSNGAISKFLSCQESLLVGCFLRE